MIISTLLLLSSIFLMSPGYVFTFEMKNGAKFKIDSERIANIEFEETATPQPYPILEDATEVPASYFKGVLAPIPLPSTLKVINGYAFFGCLNKFLVIPEGVEEIENSGLAKGEFYSYYHWWNDECVESDIRGNVEWIYLPKSVKKLGENSLEGCRYSDRDWSYYNDNPIVVMAGDVPPEGFIDAIWYEDNSSLNPSIVYVPQTGYDNYIEARINKFKGFQDGEEWIEEGFDAKCIPIYSYQPVSVEITGGTAESNYTYSYQPTSENQGEIKHVRWAVSDESIATISNLNKGELRPLKVGKTYVQCIVSTPASDGKEIEFYFFKPVEVTADMLSY